MHPTTKKVIDLFHAHGSSQYGSEAVTQLEHGIQAAMLAEQSGADADLITASLLHDVGHLLHDLPDDAPDMGIDDRHEVLGERWLISHFPATVVEPVRMHVDAKRYLCAVDKDYLSLLSPPSVQSLALQGGPMNAEEVAQFESLPHYQRAVTLRRWDDLAKDPTLKMPPVEHFAKYIDQAAASFVAC
jgi:phosphonate degradation associated HDIG domain protein